MVKKDVVVGETYMVKVSNKEQPVKIIRVHPISGWVGVNVNTGRTIRIKTAGKLRRKA